MKHERVTKKIGFLYWSNRKLFTKIFPQPIGPGQAAFLICLTEDTEVRQDSLVSMIGVDKAIGTRTIRKLNEAGYIQRRRDPENYRAYLISLTDEGSKMKRAILDVLDSINKSLFQDFTDEEQEIMLNYLDRMIENVRQKSLSCSEESARKIHISNQSVEIT
ncbi:MAG: MarR family transcriptional regulator [Methanoregula sp.]